ncbi:MAG: YciI family protein [Chloroflexota bacterium]|nr:YciI family protein [Chloroflexota bacterium]
MKYMFLIYGSPDNVQTPEVMQQWFAFDAEARAYAGYNGGEALHPVQAATTVRTSAGQAIVTDGPFAETKEVLGGYYLMDCPDLDEALVWARKLNAIDGSTLEVRPIVVF